MIETCVIRADHGSPRHAFLKSGVDIYTCPTCGCVMADLAFVHEQYEAGSYYTMSFQDKEAIEREWGFRWRHILRTLKRFVGAPRILDVGAGNGYFVFLARTEFGFDANGIEISEAETAYARKMFGVEFLRADAARAAGQYDVVTSFNVLEHVAKPLLLLADMSEKLAPGGLLVLTTPNPSCIHRRVLGLQRWSMVCPPHHINLFTRPALQELLGSAGFEILTYSTLSTYINYVRKFDTESLLLRRMVFQALKSVNLGADHFVVCRKTRSAAPQPH